MTAEGIAAIMVALIGAVSGVTSAVLSAKARKRTAQIGEAAKVFESWDRLAEQHGAEINRLVERLEHADEEITRCEERCARCNEQIGDLVATVHTLQSVVRDEVVKAAADVVLQAVHEDAGAELDQVRRFLREMEGE